jgi:IS30 family transposase
MVSARGGKSNLLALVDRKSRKVSLQKTLNREANTTRRALFQLLREELDSGGVVSTLTVDNDTAYNHLPLLEPVFTKEKLEVYFCYPYKAWERGSVEAILGILRRWFPRGTSFDDVSEEKIAYVEKWFNNRPMEVLDGKTPNEVHYMQLEMAA